MSSLTMSQSDGNTATQGQFLQHLLEGYFAVGALPAVEPGQSSAPPMPVVAEPPETLDVARLGWTKEQAGRVRSALGTFQDNWNAPGMELYDTI